MQSSPLLALHEQAGARLAPRPEAPDTTSVLTFGDVPAEYRAAQEACALLDDTDGGAVRVGGSDAAAFLHRLLANDVRGLEAGGGNRNLLLTGKGKIRFDFALFHRGEDFLLHTSPGSAGGLVAALDMYLFNEDVQLEDKSEETAPISLCGPRAAEVLGAALGESPPETDYAWKEIPYRDRRAFVAAVPVAGSPGFRVDAGPEAAASLWSAFREAGGEPIGIAARDILRVEAGAALYGVDVSDEIYPQEARLEAGFNLSKGCYIGQEVVAKIDTYGGLNKRLMALRVSHDDPVPPGTRLLFEEEGRERNLGVTTSWAYSFVLDTGLVLAYVKRRHQDVGVTFKLGDTGAEATIVAMPVRAGAVTPAEA